MHIFTFVFSQKLQHSPSALQRTRPVGLLSAGAAQCSATKCADHIRSVLRATPRLLAVAHAAAPTSDQYHLIIGDGWSSASIKHSNSQAHGTVADATVQHGLGSAAYTIGHCGAADGGAAAEPDN